MPAIINQLVIAQSHNFHPTSLRFESLEPVFSKVKSILKENDAIFQTCSRPKLFLTMAFGMITAEDTRHCGYMYSRPSLIRKVWDQR